MNKVNNYIKRHNLVNRIYDMVLYYNVVKETKDEKTIKKFFLQNLKEVSYVEELAKYFETKIHKCKKNIDLRLNLEDLVNDLNYLKQYLN